MEVMRSTSLDRPWQSGLGLPALLLCMVLGGLGWVLIQVVPTWAEYQLVRKTVRQASEAGSHEQVRQTFDRQAQIDGIHALTGRDLQIVTQGSLTQVSFSYQREIHLVGPAWLTLKYSGRAN